MNLIMTEALITTGRAILDVLKKTAIDLIRWTPLVFVAILAIANSPKLLTLIQNMLAVAQSEDWKGLAIWGIAIAIAINGAIVVFEETDEDGE